MAVYQLSNGKLLQLPDGLTKRQTLNWLFDNLKDKPGYEKDVKLLGDKLNTSGWGATIGGTLGGIAGGIGGVFTSPTLVANPVTLGAAGGAAGAALGEGIEQWWTGKGDWEDIGREAAYGGILGGVGGGATGAAIKGGLKTATALGAAHGGIGGAKEAGVPGAVTGALTGAVTGGIAGKGLSLATQKLGLDKPVKSAVQIGKDFGKNYLNAQWLNVTGRSAAGRLQASAAKWQLKRDLLNKVYNESVNAFKKSTGKSPTLHQRSLLRQSAKHEVDDLLEDKRIAEKARREFSPEVGDPNTGELIGRTPKGPLVKGRSGRMAVEDPEGYFDVKTGERLIDDPEYFAQGGQVRRSDPEGRYTKRVAESGILSPALDNEATGWATESKKFADANKDIAESSSGILSSALDFVPIVGDVKGAYELYDEINKPNPNWYLVGALGGAAVLGIVPGVGDAAAKAIKEGARRAGKLATGKLPDVIPQKLPPEKDEFLEMLGIESPNRYDLVGGDQYKVTKLKADQGQGSTIEIHIPRTYRGTADDWVDATPETRIQSRWEAEGRPVWNTNEVLPEADRVTMSKIFYDGIIYGGDVLKDASGFHGNLAEGFVVQGVPSRVIKADPRNISTIGHETGHAIDSALNVTDGVRTVSEQVPDDIREELLGIIGRERGILDIPDDELSKLQQKGGIEASDVGQIYLDKYYGKGTLWENTDALAYEGIADAFHMWMKNPDEFKRVAPKTAKHLTTRINNDAVVRQIIDTQTAQGVPMKTIIGSLAALGVSASVINSAVGEDVVKDGEYSNKGGFITMNKGGKVSSDKISKIYKEGYTAPGQAYAIAKSMGYNTGGILCKSKAKRKGIIQQ